MKKLVAFVCGVTCTASFADAEAEAVQKFEVISGKLQSSVSSSTMLVRETSDEVLAKLNRPDRPFPRFRGNTVSLSNLAVDVRKTDSLISPLTGHITFNCSFKYWEADSRDQLVGREKLSMLGDSCLALYALQSSQWVLKSFSCNGREVSAEDTTVVGMCRSHLPQ